MRYTFLELIRTFGYIEIPQIQRDYAQGRKCVREVRDSFILYLKEILFKDGASDNLDFIYGMKGSQDRLILIDGQQRITTLFLLHWYLAIVGGNESQIDFQKQLRDDGGSSRFLYNTRPSAKDFCDCLVANIREIRYVPSDKPTISASIKNQKWFLLGWEEDPTVSSMFTMLDTIEREFKGGFSVLYNRLSQGAITVDFLELKANKSDDSGNLYIRMNSRGKPLSRFENLKAQLLAYFMKNESRYDGKLHQSYFVNEVNNLGLAQKIAWFFDIRWTDSALKAIPDNGWKDCNKKINKTRTQLLDDLLFSLIVLYIMNSCLCQSGKDGDQSYLYLDSKWEYRILETPYDTIGELLNSYDYDGSITAGLVNFLNDITSSDKDGWRVDINLPQPNLPWLASYSVETYLKNILTVFEKDERPTYPDLLKFHAFTSYYRYYGDKKEVPLEAWLRFINNIIENSSHLIGTGQGCLNAMRSVDIVCSKFKDFRDNPLVLKDGKYPGLDNLQIDEEWVKAKLVKDGFIDRFQLYETDIKLYSYFSGQLRYPLEYAGAFDENPNFNIRKFNFACRIVHSFFIEGKSDRLDMLTRAVLSKGDYMITLNNRVYSLLEKNHRDYSWKRFLKERKERVFFTALMDKLDPDDIDASLQRIIDESDVSGRSWWIQVLVKCPEMLGKVHLLGSNDETAIWEGSRNYIFYDNNDAPWIYPLKGEKSRISSVHKEFASVYAYVLLKKAGVNLSPFKELRYYEKATEDGTPCCVLNDWLCGSSNYAIDIFRNPQAAAVKYCIRLFDRNNVENAFEEMSDILVGNGLILDGNGYTKSCGVDDFLDNIRSLLDELKAKMLQ